MDARWIAGITVLILAGCHEANDAPLPTAGDDTGAPPPPHTAADDTAPPPPHTFDDYLELASSLCEPVSDRSREQVLFGLQNFPDHTGPRGFLQEEMGGDYVFVNSACELFMRAPARPELGDYEVEWAYIWEPPIYKQLTVSETAYIMSQFRLLEWDRMEEERFYSLSEILEPDFRLGFQGAKYRVSFWYKEAHDDGEQTAHFHELDWLIRAIVSYDPRQDPSVMEGTAPYKGAEMRAVVQLADSSADAWDLVASHGLVHEWPLSVSPQLLRAEATDGGYTLGTSKVVAGNDASALRELVAITLAEGSVPATRMRAIATTFEEERLYLWARESLPMEGENGIVEALGGRTTGWSTGP